MCIMLAKFPPRCWAGAPAADLLELARERHATALPGAALILSGPDGSTIVENAESLLAQGVIVSSLEEAAERHPDLVQRGLSGIGIGESYFVAMWNALVRGGVFIHVPAGMQAVAPVWIAHLAAGDGQASFPATLVVLDDHASLTLVEDLVGPADPAPRPCVP